MKKSLIICALAILSAATLTSCNRGVRTAHDITPGNCYSDKLDWRYGAGDIRIQTTKVTSDLMDRWYYKSGWQCENGKPRIIITEIDNRTDTYISTDMIRDIIESIAIDDGRFTVVVGDYRDDQELSALMNRYTNDPQYQNSSKLQSSSAIAPQFLGKIRITKAVTSDRMWDYHDYRMTITLYDIETKEAIDSSWDVLSKKVHP
jgi:hypothetical protein